MAAEAGGYSSPFWLTYRQAQLVGAQVRKGERGTIAIFYKNYVREVADEVSGEMADERRRVLKSFVVFNACQVDGLPGSFFPAPRLLPNGSQRDAELDAFFQAIPARIRHGGDQAFYSPVRDEVTMPAPGLFSNLEHYRATLAHELSHWTGHEAVFPGS
jgi:antirestriction protein ArdC